MRTKIPGPRLKDPVRQPVKFHQVTPNQVASDLALIKVLTALAIAVAIFCH